MSCRLALCSSLALSKLKLRTTCNQTWTNGKKIAWQGSHLDNALHFLHNAQMQANMEDFKGDTEQSNYNRSRLPTSQERCYFCLMDIENCAVQMRRRPAPTTD